MDNTTRRLVDHVLEVRYEDLPETVVAHSKRRVLDTLGCAIAAFDLPVAVAARTLASRSSFDDSELDEALAS